MTRLVAVLGYSERASAALHPVCRARLDVAAAEAKPDDAVLFSGWARRGSAAPEADLMAASWGGPKCSRLVDRHARTTCGNAIAVARAARELGVGEVLVVTSRWHARRAGILMRAALLGSGVRLRLATAEEPLTPGRGLREAASWFVVPILAVVAARTR